MTKDSTELREAWLKGYEAGHAAATGRLKGISWEEAKKQILEKRPELAKLMEEDDESRVR